jgi:hypothetical protein
MKSIVHSEYIFQTCVANAGVLNYKDMIYTLYQQSAHVGKGLLKPKQY